MRRRMRMRVRRPKRKGAWLLSANFACAQQLTVQGCATEVSNPDTFQVVFTPVAEAILGSSGEINDVTVARLVGDWMFGATLNEPTGSGEQHTCNLMVAEGMYIADQPSTGGATQLDPSDSGDMCSRDWMWMRSSIWEASFTELSTRKAQPFKPKYPTYDSHYDVRVKRKMRAAEEIVYAIAVYLDESQTVDPNPSSNLQLSDISAYLYGQGRAYVLL